MLDGGNNLSKMVSTMEKRAGVAAARKARNTASVQLALQIFEKAKKLYRPSVKQYRVGFQLLKQAAALECADAHEWLGAAYGYGLGTRPNRRLAFARYRRVAGPRNPNAEHHVGIFYLDGR